MLSQVFESHLRSINQIIYLPWLGGCFSLPTRGWWSKYIMSYHWQPIRLPSLPLQTMALSITIEIVSASHYSTKQDCVSFASQHGHWHACWLRSLYRKGLVSLFPSCSCISPPGFALVSMFLSMLLPQPGWESCFWQWTLLRDLWCSVEMREKSPPNNTINWVTRLPVHVRWL